MRTFIEHQYHCQFIEWDAPVDEGDTSRFVVLTEGRGLIVADTLALVLAELQSATHQPLRLAA